MAIYEVQAPDGTILEIEGPDDATNEELSKAAASQWNPTSPQAVEQEEQGFLSQLGDIVKTGSKMATMLNPASQAGRAVSDMSLEDAGKFFESNEGHEFDPNSVLMSAGAGATLGGTLGFVGGGPAGAGVGAVGGVTLGLIGGVAEELTRSLGGSDAMAMIAGLASGGGASLIKSAGNAMGKNIAASDTAYLSRPIRAVMGAFRSVDKAGMDKAEALVRKNALGERKPVDFISTPNQDRVQQALQAKLPKGMQVPSGGKVSGVYRDKLYSTMDMLRDNGVPFTKSKAFKELQTDLSEGQALSRISKADIEKIKQISASQIDRRPGVVGRSNDALLNLAQNGGKFNNRLGESETLISDEAKTLLANRFNQYFDDTGNGALYNDLKAVEKAEIVARTADDVPLLLMGKLNPKELQDVANNIKATPESKQYFMNALGEYFSAIPSGGTAAKTGANLMKEFERIAPTLKQSKIMSPRELNAMQDVLKTIPKDISAQRRKEILTKALNSAMISGISAKVGNENGL